MSNQTEEDIETKEQIEFIAKEYGQSYEAELFSHIEELMQAHTKQRLTTVKEKVENMESFGTWKSMGEEIVVNKSDVLTLIEEELQ